MKCPGQDTKYWKPGAIFEAKCPKCGTNVEFFKDDTTRKCHHCQHRFLNPKMDFGCAAYCQYAEQCLGDLPPELIAQKEDFLKDRVAIEMKRYFGRDFKRIGHAAKVARYAERIGIAEGGNMAVILCAAYLHDIGIHEAEKKHQHAVSQYHESEGIPIAREILTRLNAHQSLIEEVCAIIGRHHHPQKEETINFKTVYDADFIVNLEDKQRHSHIDLAKLHQIIEQSCLTNSGRDLAKAILTTA